MRKIEKIVLMAIIMVAIVMGILTWLQEESADAAEGRGYLAVGDSITAGVGTTNGMSYADRADVDRIGIGGVCWSDSCGALSFREAILPKIEALSHQPQTLVFHLGVNDLVLGVPYDTLIQRVSDMRSELRQMGYRVVLGTVIPSPQQSIWSTTVSGNGQTVQWNRLKYNQWVRTQHTYLDYAKPLQCQEYQCPGLSNLGDPHVNDKGAGLMAQVLRTWIRSDT